MGRELFLRFFPRRLALIGMLHVWMGDLQEQISQALEDASRMKSLSAFLVENYGWGYAGSNTTTEETAVTIGRVMRAVARNFPGTPVGVNLLPNDYEKAFFIAKEFHGNFVQLDHVTGNFEGVTPVDPVHLNEIRDRFSPSIALLGGIQPKYYSPSDDEPLTDAARRVTRLCDAIVVTGAHTGGEANIDDVQAVRAAIGDHPLLVGSGLNDANARQQLGVANGAIIGSFLKSGGVVRQGASIDPARVKRLLTAIR